MPTLFKISGSAPEHLEVFFDVSAKARETYFQFFPKLGENPHLKIFSEISIKVYDSRNIALFVVSESMIKLFSIDCVNMYFSQSIE